MSRAALAIIAALALAVAGLTLWGSLERSGRLAALSASAARERVLTGAVAAQKALRVQEQAQAKEHANDADDRYAAMLAAARNDTARYADLHRLQPKGDSSPAQPIDQAGSSAVSQAVPTGIVVDSADVQACGELYAYSIAAHDWALTVGE